LIDRDINGDYHFHGSFRNAKDVKNTLNELHKLAEYRDLVEAESVQILDLFERNFNHQAFTGRSGTFFAYEGLGSIYWHMVSKLLLAVQECYFHAVATGEPEETLKQLADAYHDIRKGLGYHKSPEVYGTFPTDPYSHTPGGQGAKQPGMTGQVKEEILTRFGELGLFVEKGVIRFEPTLLPESEFTQQAERFEYVDVNGEKKPLEVPANSLAFTFCQVPVVLHRNREKKLIVRYTSGSVEEIPGNALNAEVSQHIFERDHHIEQVIVQIPA
jgi:hypothetical protein